MVFSSSIFLLYFLPAFILLYSLAKKAYKNYLILVASILFYSWGAPKFVFILVPASILGFYIVRMISNTDKKHLKKRWLAASVVLNIGLLAYFKYANFFVENVNLALTKMGFENIAWVEVALPIGISFWAFQTMTYAIDIYRKTEKPLKSVADYLVYILSFPQMIAGPIVRFGAVSKELRERNETIDDKLLGFYRFCIGLAKKVLVANVMAEQADAIFNADIDTVNTGAAWVGTLAYTFQIYFDFSGYSDMAIGLGRMMGFRFPENFDSPYTSRSITEFWRRWHITLGTFMRDYLYIPLGGNRVSKRRMFINLWIVFLLSGLWHGASWNYVLWGAYHGLFLVLDRVFLDKLLKKAGVAVSVPITFLLAMFGWVLFKIEDLDQLGAFIQKLFAFDAFEIEFIPAFIFTLIMAVFFSFITLLKPGKKLEKFFFEREKFGPTQHMMLTVLSLVLFTLSLSSITASGFNPFIYFRF